MINTYPTCHAFEMLAVHHDATFIPTELTCPDYTVGGQTIPSISASAWHFPLSATQWT